MGAGGWFLWLAGLGLLSWLRARMVVALVLLCARSWWLVSCRVGVVCCVLWVIGLLFLVCWLVRARRVCGSVWGVWLRVFGESGCLGAGCVVSGGVLPVWLGGAVASGGVSVGFDVGGRAFTFGGVSAPVSGSSVVDSVSSLAPSSVVSVSPGSVSGCALAAVGAASSPVPSSGFLSASGCAASGGSASGSSLGVGGVRVCVPCAVRVFGDSWCSLVLRRWVRAAGVDVAKVDALLGSASGSGSVRSVASGGAASSSEPAVVSGFPSPSCSPSPVSGGSASLRSVSGGGGRVGAGFGARVRDWGACVGVGGGVVSGGDVVSGWWAGWRSRVGGLASSVGVKGLVLAGLVGVVVLVSVVVLVG